MYPVKILEPLLSDSLCARDVEQAASEGCVGQFLELAQCSAYSLTRILTKNGVMRWPYSLFDDGVSLHFLPCFSVRDHANGRGSYAEETQKRGGISDDAAF